MFFSEATLDDLMHSVLSELLNKPFSLSSSRSKEGLGPTSEMVGVMLHLQNPRFRLSRDETKGTLFSALGELLWYLSGDNDLQFISYYIKSYKKESEDGKTVYGGYGPRLFNFRNKHNQVANIINLLKNRPTSRKAVIQLFDAIDVAGNHKEIPCTCTLQFLLREDRLHMFTSMRSNDAYTGLPHDIFCFTMIQEIVARSLGADLGGYYHAVGSLHVYEEDKAKAQEYLSAGYQPTTLPMPEMPNSEPWQEIHQLLIIEERLRKEDNYSVTQYSGLDPYWADFAHLLKAFSIFKKKIIETNDLELINNVKASLTTQIYDSYINKKLRTLTNQL